MPKALRFRLLSLWDLLVSFGPFILLTVGLLALAWWWLDPVPPKRVTLATGPAQSAYAAFGTKYQQALRANGIEVVLLTSEGASDNLRLLREGKADLGFVQGGSGEKPDGGADIGNSADASPFVSLGDLFLEPVWLFYREDSARRVHKSATLGSLAQLKGLRVNVGTPGSGVPNLMLAMFKQNGLEIAPSSDSATPSKAVQENLGAARRLPESAPDPGSARPPEGVQENLGAARRFLGSGVQLSRLDQTAATVAFLNGEIDAQVFASAPESLMVQMLLQAPGVKLFNFAQNDAYSRRLPFLSAVRLPRGVVDLAADVPPRDVRLVASTTTLLARDQVHPAVLQLFSQASLTIHGGAGWFSRPHEFPIASNAEFPLAKEAERTIRGGVPLLQRYLPFSIANILERMWLSLGIILVVLLPLSRIVPPLYEFRIRSRVFRWYAQLRDIENRHEAGEFDIQGLTSELDQLEGSVGKVVVPLSHADELYALRNHIQMVRRRLTGSVRAAPPAEAPPAEVKA